MPKVPGVNHQRAVVALEKAGFQIARQGKHITMTYGTRRVSIPRQNPINAITMGGIVKDAGLTVEEFGSLCKRQLNLPNGHHDADLPVHLRAQSPLPGRIVGQLRRSHVCHSGSHQLGIDYLAVVVPPRYGAADGVPQFR